MAPSAVAPIRAIGIAICDAAGDLSDGALVDSLPQRPSLHDQFESRALAQRLQAVKQIKDTAALIAHFKQ